MFAFSYLGFQSKLIPLFDAAFSPRNLVLVAVKPKEAQSWMR